MKKAFEIFDTILVVIILGFALLMLVPRLFHITPYVVMTSSMYPTIPAGSICFIDEKDTEPEIEDVIAYKLSTELITHRVVGIDENGNYITQGDNNDAVDLAPVTLGQVVGKNIFWVPVVGIIMTWVKTVPGIIVTISVLAVYLILSRVIMNRKDSWN